jgi:hypothetical protein
MNKIETDNKVFSHAHNFVLTKFDGVTEEILKSYLATPDKPVTLKDIFKRLLQSAKNANMKDNVIGDLDLIRESVLFDFSAIRILNEYKDKSQLLGKVIAIKPNIMIAEKSIWPKYCRTILEAAKFISQYDSADDFHLKVKFFYDDDRIRKALPMLIESEIYGIGFPLACDFLKEIGYDKFGKPDVHIKDIFLKTGLAENNDDLSILADISRIAENVGTTAYAVDKLFWLIGSGYFYKHKQSLGKKGKFGSKKDDFVTLVNASEE